MKDFKIPSKDNVLHALEPNNMPIYNYFGAPIDFGNPIEAYPTDFALLNGCRLYGPIYHRHAPYFLSDSGLMGHKVIEEPLETTVSSQNKCTGIRPSFDVHDYFLSGAPDFLVEFKYGYYPTFAFSEEYTKRLEELKDQRKVIYHSEDFDVYHLYGQNGVRVVKDTVKKDQQFWDGRKIEAGKPYWFKFEPIVWYFNLKEGVAISKFVINSGMTYKNIEPYLKRFSKNILFNKGDKNEITNLGLINEAFQLYEINNLYKRKDIEQWHSVQNELIRTLKK